MTTFDEREKAFERKFIIDQELKFKAEAQRGKLLGEWAAGELGLAGAGADAYVKALRKADLAEKGDEDLFRKLRRDFDDKKIAMTDAAIREKMADFLAEAVARIESGTK